jgi:predicted nucleic acid-binding Zn ribbon protein
MDMKDKAWNKGTWELPRDRHKNYRAKSLSLESLAIISEVVPIIMKQLGLENRLWEQALINEWDSLVGPQVAKYTRAGRLERKILHIFVDHPTWLSELSRYGKKQIIENLQKRFGPDKIKGIRLQLDPDHHSRKPSG